MEKIFFIDYFNAVHSDSPPNKTDLATSVHKGEEPQPQLSNNLMENKFEAEQKGQPTNKQHSPRNDGDQMQNGMSKF